jgi:hypothetical protein
MQRSTGRSRPLLKGILLGWAVAKRQPGACAELHSEGPSLVYVGTTCCHFSRWRTPAFPGARPNLPHGGHRSCPSNVRTATSRRQAQSMQPPGHTRSGTQRDRVRPPVVAFSARPAIVKMSLATHCCLSAEVTIEICTAPPHIEQLSVLRNAKSLIEVCQQPLAQPSATLASARGRRAPRAGGSG